MAFPKYKFALLKHYPFKSLEKFFIKKYMKNSPESKNDQRDLTDFFKVNFKTLSKINFIKELDE